MNKECQEYWKLEKKLKALAKKTGLNVEELINNFEEFDDITRIFISETIDKQVDLIHKIHPDLQNVHVMHSF